MNPTHADFTTEDPKVRLMHHILMQDYQKLHLDTEAMRKRLKTMLERKATLIAEVRFLRRRYRHLRQEDQPVKQLPGVKKGRGRSNGGKKIKTRIRVKVTSSNKKSEAEETKHVALALPDLNHSVNETKTSLEKRVPLFDLNLISGEEEEEAEAANISEERMRVEESKRMSIIEMQKQKNKTKLSSCRNGGNGSNKRKISWQDPPVAPLRV